jgi:pimeloyl-ACP methyl ester carboxylesterase
MYYEVEGAGDPLLLLHGFGGCGQQWEPFAARLAERYRLIIPDLRGHGHSTNPGGTFTHGQAAGDVLALLDTLAVGRFKAMGISTGGMTLLHIATRDRERIDAMVLIGSTPYFPEEARIIMRGANPDEIPPDVEQMYHRCARRGDEQVRELVTQFGGFQHSYDDMNFTAPYRARSASAPGSSRAVLPGDGPGGAVPCDSGCAVVDRPWRRPRANLRSTAAIRRDSPSLSRGRAWPVACARVAQCAARRGRR